MIENIWINYARKIKKVIEIKGERLEDFHLREIRKEAKNGGEIFEEDKSLWNQKKDDEHLVKKVAYNDKRLNILIKYCSVKKKNKKN